MSVQYQGKSPGKVWRFWQKTKALAHTPFEYSTAKQVKEGGKNTGITAGTAVAYEVITTHVLPLIPFPLVPLIVGLAASASIIYFGIKAYKNFKSVTGSSFVSSYVRKQETKWLDNQAKRNAPKTGLKAKVSGLLNKIPLPLVKAGKWLGYAAAAVGAAVATGGALHYAGLAAFSTGATATTVLAGVAHAAAIVGLTATAAVATVTGLAVAAIPLGIAAAFWCRGNAYARNPSRQIFMKPSNSPRPISEGQVFKPKPVSVDFGPSAAPSDAFTQKISDQRQKAAEERAAARAKKSGTNNQRF